MSNLKFIYTVFLAICFTNIYSQNKYISITYSAYFGEDDAFISLGRPAFFKSKQEVESQEFQLIFNDTIAKFATIDKIENAMPLIEIYKFKNMKTASKIKNDDKVILILDRDQSWQITSETKIINQFTCYKATSNFKVVRVDKVFQFPIIAWFCPDLPSEFGPMGYGGLPGLILELQERNIVYGVQKINLEANIKNINLPTFNKYNEMTESEWEVLISEKMKNED